MANYNTLKTAIETVVKTNGNNEITGALLQQSLLAMVNSLGANYQYAGVATPSTNPGTPDQNIFYIASTAGTYSNFGGLVLDDGEISILKYNGAWSKDSTGAASLEIVEQLGQYVENPEFVRLVTGPNGEIWYGVRRNADFYFGAGCPSQVKEFVQEVAFLKVDKEDGKSLISENVANAMSIQEDREWLELTDDKERKILEGIKKDGSRHFFNRVVIKGASNDVKDSPEWVRLLTDRNGNIVIGVRGDSSVVIPRIKNEQLEKLETDVFKLLGNQYPPIYKHGPIVAFVDDDSGQYVPEIWNEIMERTGIRFGIACITGMMGGVVTPTRPQYVQMTLAELQSFYDKGCEIYSHSWSHHSFSGDISLALVEEECWKSKNWLDANGFTKNSNTIVYPGGMQNVIEEKTTIVRRNYEYGVATTDGSNGVNKEPIDKLHISRCNADANTLDYLKGCVDTAVSESKLLVVMTHAYELMGLGTTSLSPDKDVNIQRVVDMINYAKQQGAIILPLCEALHQIYGW